MAALQSNTKDVILAVLRESKERGVGALTRTALVKFVYLLDCIHAEDHEGKIASGARWVFHHFGPYAQEISAGVEEMARIGLIQSRMGETSEKEFSLYWLGEFPAGPSLQDMGLGSNASTRFSRLMRDFGSDLPKLLDHVYFRTIPMQDAAPGQELKFDRLAEHKPSGYRHVHIQDHAKILRLATLVHGLSQKAGAGNAKALEAHRPIYDKVYSAALNALDSREEEQGEFMPVPFRAALA